MFKNDFGLKAIGPDEQWVGEKNSTVSVVDDILETDYEEVSQIDRLLVASLGVWDQSPINIESELELRKKSAEKCVEKVESWLDGWAENEKVVNGTSLSAPPTFWRYIPVQVIQDGYREGSTL